MKFQDSSFNGLKVTVGTKSVTHAPTHARSKSNMPHQLFQSWGHNDLSFYYSSSLFKSSLAMANSSPSSSSSSFSILSLGSRTSMR